MQETLIAAINRVGEIDLIVLPDVEKSGNPQKNPPDKWNHFPHERTILCWAGCIGMHRICFRTCLAIAEIPGISVIFCCNSDKCIFQAYCLA